MNLLPSVEMAAFQERLMIRYYNDRPNGLVYGLCIDDPRHKTFLSKLSACLEMDDMEAKSVTVLLSGSGTVSLPLFDFLSMFWSLLDEPRRGISQYLMINRGHRNSKPTKFNRRPYNGIHSWNWHSKTSREC